VNDLVLLDGSSDDDILRALSKRFGSDEIYQYIGSTLISVNPYKTISGLYSQSTLRKYVGKKIYQNPPHAYAIAERAYRNMQLATSNEAIIITGESGAGKTEASKKVMEYIAAMSSKSKKVQQIKDELLETNPLLEAFGNAKTRRNDNSSRFGKYLELQFLYGDPAGGRISQFLLEKNRVTYQQPGERNFHVFYQLLSDSSARSNYGLGKTGDFRYFSDPDSAKVRGMDDSRGFSETQRAMEYAGMDSNDQAAIFAILAGILHIGNVEFQSAGRDQSNVSNMAALGRAADALGVNERDLSIALTHRTVKSGIESVRTGLSVEKAEFARDSLAKTIYGKLFEWIVQRANETIHTEQFSTTIGVLDIYGFEILGVNGFEQLCINHTNERLHQLFIELTLRGEQSEYAKEGIPWKKVNFVDNLPICELIEKRGGIYALIDEESIFPQGTDASLIKKLSSNIRAREFQMVPGAVPTQFQINHYAGTVTYDVTGFLDSNRDTLFPDLVQVVYHTAQNPIAKDLFKDHPAVDSGRKTNKRAPSIAKQYKEQLMNLLDRLKSNNQHYIRCIKPNDAKRAGMFQNELVMEQVRYLGLSENLVVRRAGYAFRMPYDEFASKYKAVLRGHHEWQPDSRKLTEKILKEYGCREFESGKTKVFIKNAKDILGIEDARKNFMDTSASYLPEDDGLIYADKVFAFNAKISRSELLFVVGGKGFYFFDPDGRQTEHYIPYSDMELIGLNGKEGWITCHSEYPGKMEDDPKVQVTYLCENIYPAEVRNFVEVLGNVGIEIPITNTSTVSQDARDPAAYKANQKLIGTGMARRPAIGGGGGPAGGCCSIS